MPRFDWQTTFYLWFQPTFPHSLVSVAHLPSFRFHTCFESWLSSFEGKKPGGITRRIEWEAMQCRWRWEREWRESMRENEKREDGEAALRLSDGNKESCCLSLSLESVEGFFKSWLDLRALFPRIHLVAFLSLTSVSTAVCHDILRLHLRPHPLLYPHPMYLYWRLVLYSWSSCHVRVYSCSLYVKQEKKQRAHSWGQRPVKPTVKPTAAI